MAEPPEPIIEHILDNVDSADEKVIIMARAISSARNGIVITDPNQEDNPIIYANPSFLKLSGYAVDEVIGRNCRFLQGDFRKQEAIEELRTAIEVEKSITVVLKNFRKDGSLFWNELTVSPVHDKRGKLINFIGIQNDISARKEAEKRIQEFYSIVSHELRTPLTSIRTSLGLLEEGSGGELTEESEKIVEIALRNTDRLVRLVSDMLDFRKIESENLKLNFEQLSAQDVVERVIRELSSTAESHKITLQYDQENGIEFSADRDRIIQILTNLTANAIKFSPKMSVVKIEAKHGREGFIKFSVTDTGPGIPRSEFGKLFKKFQQVDSSDTRRAGGTGLGLNISKSLVELHGGNIGVDSKLGHGSTFWFEIPEENQ